MRPKLGELFDEGAPWFDEAAPRWLAGGRVQVYGAGSAGRDLVRTLVARGVEVTAILDRSTNGRDFEGIPIVHPNEASERELPLLVGIHNPGVALAPLFSALRAAGHVEVVSFVSIYAHLGDSLGFRYFASKPSFLRKNRAAIERALELFSDETSRELFVRVLAFRITGDPSHLSAPDLTNQYFPLDVPRPEARLAFVDAGAFVGDTLEWLSKSEIPIDRALALEPDPENFRLLAEKVRSFGRRLGPVTLLPCAVAEESEFLTFSGDANAASHLDPRGTTRVLAVRLDDALAGFRPNFIKMDVEGAECGALRGARKVLGNESPILAISSYHRPEDHFAIPLLIDELVGSGRGRFFLRSHGEQSFDTVVYFVPD